MWNNQTEDQQGNKHVKLTLTKQSAGCTVQVGHDSGLGEPQARMREENMERIREVGGGEPAEGEAIQSWSGDGQHGPSLT